MRRTTLSVDCTDLPYDFSPTNLAQLRIVVRRADIGRQLLLYGGGTVADSEPARLRLGYDHPSLPRCGRLRQHQRQPVPAGHHDQRSTQLRNPLPESAEANCGVANAGYDSVHRNRLRSVGGERI
jgi:hypothetical protein